MIFTVILNCITYEILQRSLQRGFVASNRWQVRLYRRLDREIRFLDLSLTSSHRAVDNL